MEDKLIWDKTPYSTGNSLAVIIPVKIALHLRLTADTPICVCLDSGKHGSFISIWKKEEAKKE
jgi:antitoxin component of MazEF toxin-antitoxin module